MAYRPHGRAKVNPRSPRAFARCDRCGFIYNHGELRFQFDYRGPRLTNLRWLVCQTCYDKPQAQLKPILLTQDPVPVVNMRPEDYTYAREDTIFAQTPTTLDPTTGIPVQNGLGTISTQDLTALEKQPVGAPTGLDQNAVPPLYIDNPYNVTIPTISVVSDGFHTVTVTCSSPHGLSNNDQVSIGGVSDSNAFGIYSVTVVSATVFTYQTYQVVRSGNLLTSTTRVATSLVGLPPGDSQIPRI